MTDPFNPSGYGEAFARWIGEEPLQPLGAGRLDGAKRTELGRMTVASAFGHAALSDRSLADCCLAGVWLLHDGLDPAHTLCQDVATPTGSYWHGVVHRREGDHGNARYWFHRAGDHPAGPAIAEAALAMKGTTALGESGVWDAAGFVDACRRAQDDPAGPLHAACLALQRAEWRALFDWCYRGAIG